MLSSNRNELGKVDIKRGIFQGDSFSPLLFLMAVIPLTMILRQANAGYRFSGSREKVNHFILMDDLKLCGSCDEKLKSVLGVMKMFSDDVRMKFGFDNKCGVLVVEKGVKKKCEGIELPGGEMIKEIDENGYKCLWGVRAGGHFGERNEVEVEK